MEGDVIMFKASVNPAGARLKARAAARSLDREATIERGCVLTAAFTILLTVVLAHIGG
jgi:hypothetical protein